MKRWRFDRFHYLVHKQGYNSVTLLTFVNLFTGVRNAIKTFMNLFTTRDAFSSTTFVFVRDTICRQ